MGHRDLLVTHNLSEGKTHEPRPYLRRSVRRASGFVLTGNPELISSPVGLVPTNALASTKSPEMNIAVRPRFNGHSRTLTGRVIEVKTGKASSEHEFVTFALSPGPGRSSAILTIPNDEGWELDDPVQVSISMGTTSEVAVDKRDKKQKAS
jgi:hypothetical protein